ncbi:MAG TPA: SAM-dependent methyltransferase [Streptosporangiaceae bacterium]|jgi:methyltransferase (TIGR00027 family)
MSAEGEPLAPAAPGVPSRTSQVVALTRAELPRPCLPDGDPDAQRLLCDGMRPARVPGLLTRLAARTRFFDGRVMAAIASGISQVVILGAGYDDRALRFGSPGVRFFEVDQPATQQDKAARLASLRSTAARPVLAAADFGHDDVAAVLAGSGHDPGRPSLFLCEGLLVYLDQRVTTRLLGGLRASAAAGSTLAASLAVHADGLDSGRVVQVANARRRTASAEPWRTILPPERHLALITGAGWLVTGQLDAAELEPAVEPGRSLLVTATPATAADQPAEPAGEAAKGGEPG